MDPATGNPSELYEAPKGPDHSNLDFTGLKHRLFQKLSSDFYRPFRVGDIYASIFPDRHFNPDTSPDQIYHAVKGLRRELQTRKVPLDISYENGGY